MIAYPGRKMMYCPVILCLVCLLFLSGCLDHTPTPAPLPTSTPTATSTPTPSRTATPTVIPILTIQNLDDQFSDGTFQFDPAFANILSSTYMIVRSDEGYGYLSLYGTSRGKIGGFISDIIDEISPLTVTLYEGDSSFTATLEDPEYMGVSAKKPSTSENYITTMRIQAVTLRTGEQHIWKVTFHPESEMECDDVSLSPNHTWVAGNCWKDGENYLYFLNIQQGTVKTLRSPDNPCISGEDHEPAWSYYDWSPDGQWLSVACTDRHDFNVPCLISPETDEFHCRPDTEGQYPWIRAWSPDGSKVVMGTFDDYDLLITDPACLKGTQTCPEYLRVLLPYERSSGTPIVTSVVWDPTGEFIVWAGYKSPYQRSDGPTTIGVVNVESGEEYYIGWAPGTTVHSISPDGKWIVIRSDEGGWGLLSIDGSVLRSIGQDIDEFLGWLVVP